MLHLSERSLIYGNFQEREFVAEEEGIAMPINHQQNRASVQRNQILRRDLEGCLHSDACQGRTNCPVTLFSMDGKCRETMVGCLFSHFVAFMLQNVTNSVYSVQWL